MIHGWGPSQVGRFDEGIKLIETSIAIQWSKNAKLNVTYALRQLAESLNLKGSYVAARDAAREGLKMSERHGEVASKAELYRIMGESARSLAKMGAYDEATHTRSGSTVSPEACFRAAVELTRKQGAKGFELRSSLALGREVLQRGMTKDAIKLVSEIRVQFNEGLDTQNLRDADAFIAAAKEQPQRT